MPIDTPQRKSMIRENSCVFEDFLVYISSNITLIIRYRRKIWQFFLPYKRGWGFLKRLVARDEPLGLEPVESPSAVRHVDEPFGLSSGRKLMSSRSEPNGLQVERLETERLGRVEGRCLFVMYLWGKPQPRACRGECGGGKIPS